MNLEILLFLTILNIIKAYKAPYQVAFYENNKIFCGGSLITPNYVLTAAQCLQNKNSINMTFGRFNDPQTESSVKTLISTNFNPHPKYNPSTYEYDIGLIKLPHSMDLNDDINVIQLSSDTGALIGTTITHTQLELVHRDPYQVDLKVVPKSLCEVAMGIKVKDTPIFCGRTRTFNCGIVTCVGYVGEPALDDKKRQIGVMIIENLLVRDRLPFFYIRVDDFKEWISENSDLKSN